MDDKASYAYYEDVNQGLLKMWGERSGLDVLDVGCGFARTSAEIQARGNRVVGIESSEAAVPVARERLSEIVKGDLLDVDLGDRLFDVIIFADVLEHLPWPVGVLRRYLRWLKPGGSVIVSLPNVGLWSVRMRLLFGDFSYADTGVLDRTHLRFFTRKSARWLLAEAGLEITDRRYNPGIVRPFVPVVKRLLTRSASEGPHDPGALIDSAEFDAYLRYVHPAEALVTRIWPGALAFQMVFEAKPKS